MFEFFFKYPAAVFSKGEVVLLGGWPAWTLALLIAGSAAAIGYLVWRRGGRLVMGARAFTVWALQSLLAALILVLLWHPAVVVATLKPQQNIVAVLVDESASMAMVEDGSSRRQKAVEVLEGGLLEKLGQRFQIRMYRAGDGLERLEKLNPAKDPFPATRLAADLKQVVTEASGLPVGAVILLSDGAENAGGIDLETITQIRRQRIPVHTVGFGREKFARDIEVSDIQVAARALADSRLAAQVTFRQTGFTGTKARITLKDGGKTLAAKEVTMGGEGRPQTESLLFNAGAAGAKTIEASIEPLQGEENVRNNRQARVVNVDNVKPRILYLEGEPRWDYKFIRRAAEEDRHLELVSILRTTPNKIYRQGIAEPKELESGFPSTVEELFSFQAIVLGSVEAAYLTATQQELIKQFVDRRGGGLLLLGSRAGLSDGGYNRPPFSDLLPVTLPDRKGTFVRKPANVELTAAGKDALVTRLDENPDKNAERWKKLPYLLSYQDPGEPKPGAVVLAESIPTAGGKRYPLLATQNYGRGRVAVFASGGSWRWQMQMPVEDKSHEMFWQQMLRWLVEGTPTRVTATTPKTLLEDERSLKIRAEVKDRTYLPAGDARVVANIVGPNRVSAAVDLQPDPVEPGVYEGEWNADAAGSYLVEVLAQRGAETTGRDVITFRREDGVAENFRAEQNREVLEQLSRQTGGRYYRPSEVSKLAKEVEYSEAGIAVRETKDLWDMPAFFLLALVLKSSEWLLRRRWGVI